MHALGFLLWTLQGMAQRPRSKHHRRAQREQRFLLFRCLAVGACTRVPGPHPLGPGAGAMSLCFGAGCSAPPGAKTKCCAAHRQIYNTLYARGHRDGQILLTRALLDPGPRLKRLGVGKLVGESGMANPGLRGNMLLSSNCIFAAASIASYGALSLRRLW